MNEEIRSLFPAANFYTYLNSAAVAPMPVTAVDAVTSQLEDVSAHGSQHYETWIATKNRARGLLAGILGVRPEQVAFTRNTSDGFSAVANGLKWAAGDNIVSFEGEFPANFYPWRRIRDDYGVELRLCPERNGRIHLDELIGMIDPRTKVVTISSVQYASGFRADLERIGRRAREVDALFCVDVIQGLGAHAYDLPAQYVDAACGASHKWLCSPEGCGFIYLSDRARDRVEPTFVGWISVETPWDFADREQPFQPNALAWESGTGCSSLFYGLEKSLKLITDVGLHHIEAHLDAMTVHLCDLLVETEYDIISSREKGERSAIVCVKNRGDISSGTAAAYLESERVIVSPRGDRIRIAPHFFNNFDDIDRLVACLP